MLIGKCKIKFIMRTQQDAPAAVAVSWGWQVAVPELQHEIMNVYIAVSGLVSEPLQQ